MRILGLDPGYGRLGFGIIDTHKNQVTLVTSGVITTPARTPSPERLNEIAGDIESLIKKHSPDGVAIEEIFFSQSTTTALKVAEVRGVLLYLAAKSHLPIVELKPTAVKKALTGYGHADKRQMQEMVKRTLNLPAILKPDDASDAVAIAFAAIPGLKL